MKLYNKVKAILGYRLNQGRDGRPASIASFLMQDDCSRLIGSFGENGLHKCRFLVLVSQDEEGNVEVRSSDSCDTVRTIGLLTIGGRMVHDG